jgi:RNA-directed DNA polymerase
VKGGREANPESDRSSECPSVVLETDKQEGETLWERHKAERGVWSQGMLEALERGVKGGKWFSLIDKVYAEQTLARSWEKVRSNAGACGVDGITVARFEKQAKCRLLAVNEQLKQSRYQPLPIRRTWIPKPGSAEKRPLGIPAVVDRVVQTATRMVLEPIFEREFAPQSYGFRPGRSCKDALRRVDELLRSGHTHVVDVDIKGFFDSIPHERLMKQVGAHVADGRVLGLIEGFLKAKVMEAGKEWEPTDGTPQGGVISPLLANIYLNPLDWLMVQHGWEMVRYADDMVVLCREPETAMQALKVIQTWMSDAGLTLHPEKTRVVSLTEPGSHFDFLGYRYWRSRTGNLARLIRPKSTKNLKQKIKPLTKRANGHSMDALVRKLNPILRGWYGYYKHARAHALKEMDGWIRGRLRGILRKRKGGRGRGRGRDHYRWPNQYFDTLGLFCLEAARRKEYSSLRQGAKC